jgi:hypothetical protein
LRQPLTNRGAAETAVESFVGALYLITSVVVLLFAVEDFDVVFAVSVWSCSAVVGFVVRRAWVLGCPGAAALTVAILAGQDSDDATFLFVFFLAPAALIAMAGLLAGLLLRRRTDRGGRSRTRSRRA